MANIGVSNNTRYWNACQTNWNGNKNKFKHPKLTRFLYNRIKNPFNEELVKKGENTLKANPKKEKDKGKPKLRKTMPTHVHEEDSQIEWL